MGVDELIREIYEFDGMPEEWLEFETKVHEIIKKYSEKETEKLTDSEAMEALSMICEGIRCERRDGLSILMVCEDGNVLGLPM